MENNETKKKKEKRDKKMRLSLFKRYYLTAVSVVFFCFLVLGTTMMVFIASQWWTDKVDQLKMNVDNIAVAVLEINDDAEIFDVYTDAEKSEVIGTVLDITAQATESDYYITDTDGNVVLCHDMVRDDDKTYCSVHSSYVIPEQYMSLGLKTGFADYTTDEFFGLGKFVVATPVVYDGETVCVVFAVEDALSGLLPYIASVSKTLVLSGMIVCVLVFFALYFVLKSITKPLSEMQEVTVYLARGDFSKRAKEDYKKGDMNRFAKALNKMADALEIDNESKKSFVANVSHELKTPMTSIGGFIDGILDGTIPQEQERHYLEKVSKEVKRLARIVVAMLNLSKIEAGEIGLSPSNYEIKDQLFSTLLLFERSIEDKHIEIAGFEDMENIKVTADKDLIGQVVQNLMDNAVKFTPENGTITILAAQENGRTKVTIRNSGAGIAIDEVSRVFERFYKVDKSRSFDVKGVGLGLYICKTIINMHDGEISANSVPEQYTEFSFEIPELI